MSTNGFSPRDSGCVCVCNRYLLSVNDEEEPLMEIENVICLLKDNKDLYIQKDHLSARLDICRELVKLVSSESSHRKELVPFLSGLMTSLHDPAALNRFLQKECPGELKENTVTRSFGKSLSLQYLNSHNQVDEVCVDIACDSNLVTCLIEVLPGPSPVVRALITPDQEIHSDQVNGKETLMCWPPRASLSNTAASRLGERLQTARPVEAVMKMWPLPADLKDTPTTLHTSFPTAPQSPRERDQVREGVQSHSDVPTEHPLPTPRNDHAHPVLLETTATPLQRIHQVRPRVLCKSRESSAVGAGAQRNGDIGQSRHPPAGGPSQTTGPNRQPSGTNIPEGVVSSVFQGAKRPHLALDSPVWAKPLADEALLEDLQLNCQKPPTHGESGKPCDFKLTFGLTQEDVGAEKQVKRAVNEVFVEVKSTVKKNRAFIHLSANELDFALWEKEGYHMFRVYNAGDSERVRLCRIQNLITFQCVVQLDLT
ncbi:hypothetical protein DPEC_G00343080 [Dallia pectoralis]|uniref:Uncharacterized protein n=1 Tax=Dallia pectoralis TaxID=75939 RepID=A0ACC2F2X1_DALPE|nr:hypothetical protein DPEC_G00343080 [Dallia pectoralis]